MSNEERWKALASGEKLASRMRFDPCSVSDVILNVFEKCCESHDESRGSFRTYYLHCLKRELARVSLEVPYEQELDRQQNKFGHSPLELLITLEAEVGPGIDQVIETLSADELELLTDRFVHGYSLWKIGIKHGVVKQTIDARIRRLIAKIKDEIH